MSSCIRIILALFVSVRNIEAFTNLAKVDCGLRQIRNAKIVNGTRATAGDFPWLVSVQLFGGHSGCAGSIISDRWVLTAAHCLESKTPAIMQVSVGELTLSKPGLAKKVIAVQQIIRHPKYVPGNKDGDDIALLMLQEPIVWNDLVQPICLPNPDKKTFTGHLATAAGWGRHQENSVEEYSDMLFQVDIPIIESEKCQDWLKENKKELAVDPATMLCAGLEDGGKDTCQGDSGGPLTVEENKRQLAIGIVSKGYGCGRPKLPGIYTRVSHYIDWILTFVR